MFLKLNNIEFRWQQFVTLVNDSNSYAVMPAIGNDYNTVSKSW